MRTFKYLLVAFAFTALTACGGDEATKTAATKSAASKSAAAASKS